MKYEKILKKYNMKEEPASQYMDKKICHNKKDTEKNTDLSYRTIQRYEKKIRKNDSKRKKHTNRPPKHQQRNQRGRRIKWKRYTKMF